MTFFSIILLAATIQTPVNEAGVKGGLVVHVGCGDGKLTAALRVNDSFIVHGLDGDVTAARKHIQSLGLYGPVTAGRWSGGALPYADNLVNLIVADKFGKVSMEEVMRVLTPNGVALIGGKKVVKPWPKEIDEWTHFLHDAGNNGVAHDTRVGSPKRMQWVVEPLRSRGHEVISSVGALVTARGRIFYALDEGQPGIYSLPSKWALVARDAFNGILLWKQSLPNWGPAISLGGFTSGFHPQRLVTDGQRVFLPMGEQDVLTAFEAATGRSLGKIATAEGTSIILCDQGLLVAVLTGKGTTPTLLAARPDTLEVLWKTPIRGLNAQLTALSDGHVVYATGDAVIGLNAQTGAETWRTAWNQSAERGKKGRPVSPSLTVHDGKIYLLKGAQMAACDLRTGKRLWQQATKGSSRGELFVAAGLLWQVHGSNVIGRDLSSGEIRKTVDASPVFSKGHHTRCYRGKATDLFAITANRGAEFVSLTGDTCTKNDWIRGNCGEGVTPANGLLYVPPNQCFCYGGVMLRGFNALTAAEPEGKAPESVEPLERGPAYSEISNLKFEGSISDWPMYRHDAARLGASPVTVPAEVRPQWQATLGGRLTSPVVAGGLLVVAKIDEHSVHAFDAGDGRPRWSFIVGGRIDSAPTIHEGLVLFGCADGWAYCLSANDGRLAWRFRAAPYERYVGAFGQLESAWPVHGSVTMLDGIAYLTAGRSTYLDGGIEVFGLEPRTGRVIHHARLQGEATVPESQAASKERAFLEAFHVEGANADLLVTDGTSLYIGPLKLNAQLRRLPTPYIVPGEQKTESMDLKNERFVSDELFQGTLGKGRIMEPAMSVLRGPMGDKTMGLRLCATGGLLDDTWHNRTYWMYSAVWPGYYIANIGAKSGQLLAVDATTTYGVQSYPTRTSHSPTFTPGKKGYLLFADANTNEPVLDDRARGRDKGMGYSRSAPPKWFQWVPVRVRAMVPAGETLFVAGPPDVMDEANPYAAFEGRKGAALWSFAAADGKKLAACELDSPPVFDGMIAANSKLYIATLDGKVLCYGGIK